MVTHSKGFCTYPGVYTCSGKTYKGPQGLPLANLQVLYKQKVNSKANYKLPG